MIVTTYFKVISILTPSMTWSTARQTHSKLFLSLSGECESWVELSFVSFSRVGDERDLFEGQQFKILSIFSFIFESFVQIESNKRPAKAENYFIYFWDIFKRDASDGSKFCQRNDLKINFFLIKNPTTSHTYPTVWPDGTIMFSILVIFQHINCA